MFILVNKVFRRLPWTPAFVAYSSLRSHATRWGDRGEGKVKS